MENLLYFPRRGTTEASLLHAKSYKALHLNNNKHEVAKNQITFRRNRYTVFQILAIH